MSTPSSRLQSDSRTRSRHPTASRQSSGLIDVEAVKAQLDILTLARSFHGVNLKLRGTVHRGGCPCCGASEKKEPFQVDPKPASKMGPHFHCFSCGEYGDVFNLFALQQRGDAQIPPDKFIATVRMAAVAYGIAIPEAGTSARRSPEQILRSEVQTAWSSAHEYARERFLERTGQKGDEISDRRPLGAGSRIGILDSGLDDHLTKLGLSDEARVRAGLTGEDIAAFAPGPVLLRLGAGSPAGFSQQFSNREWVHRSPPGTQFEPAFLSARPSGRPTHRVLILVPDADRAARLATNLAALSKSDHDDARRVATIGVTAAPLDDLFDPESIARISKRAVIIAPAPDTPTRAISEYGARLFAAGIAVRIARVTPCASGTAPIGDRAADAIEALDTWEEADDYFTWQAKQIPTLQGVESWSSRRVPALLEGMPDAAMRDVFAYRVQQAADEARARLSVDADRSHPVAAGCTKPVYLTDDPATGTAALTANEITAAAPRVTDTEFDATLANDGSTATIANGAADAREESPPTGTILAAISETVSTSSSTADETLSLGL
ncbi:MAG: CHC2 zinc finger domain-containing protein [Gemmatimonadaceae bacterium]